MEESRRDIQLAKLTERAKELKCIYRVIEILRDENAELATIFRSILEAIPPGWQHPTVCEARIILEGKTYASLDFQETPWIMTAAIIIDNHVAGEIQVGYMQKVFEGEKPFLTEEERLLHAIADHLSRFIFQRRLKKTLESALTPDNISAVGDDNTLLDYESDDHWKWRYQVSERIADAMDMERYGVEAVYVIGSTRSGNAGPCSDIDLLIHFRGTPVQESELRSWLEGWGLGLAELNRVKTGCAASGSLIDCHLVTDEDIRKRTSYAVMIGSTENSAHLIRKKGTK
jgi:predicted nucleotidyltransferase